MVSASKLPLCFALGLPWLGCAGNVVEGLPRDGGPSVEVPDPLGSVEDDAGARGDADPPPDTGMPEANRDAGQAAREDASAPEDSGAPMTPADAGQASISDQDPTMNGGALARPSNGREFTSDRSKWQGSPRCKEGTGEGQVTFCDDFESQEVDGPLGPAWDMYDPNVAKTSDDVAMRGSKSLRSAPGSGASGHAHESKSFAMPSDKLFGRLFVYFDSPPPTAPNDALWTLIEVRGDGEDDTQVRVGGRVDPARGGKNFFGIGSDFGDSGDWHTRGQEPQAEVKTKTWTCVEWMFDRSNNETRVWIDNTELLSLHTTAANYRLGNNEGGKQFIHPNYRHLRVGYWVYQSSATPNPAVVFIDELVLDDEQIGCSL